MGRVAEVNNRPRFQVWASFAPRHRQVPIPREPVTLSDFDIDATIKPDLTMAAVTRFRAQFHGSGLRAVILDISNRIKITAAKLDGKPVEVYQTESIRNSDDFEISPFLVVAPKPFVDQQIAEFERITEQWQRDRDAAHGHLRDRLVTHLARTIGDEIDPLHALAAAASAIGLALSSVGRRHLSRRRCRRPVASRMGHRAGADVLAAARRAVRRAERRRPPMTARSSLARPVSRRRQRRRGALARARSRRLHRRRTAPSSRPPPTRLGVAIALLARHEIDGRPGAHRPVDRPAQPARLFRGGGAPHGAAGARRAARLPCLYRSRQFQAGQRHARARARAMPRLSRCAASCASSSRAGDVIARLGGDEFVLWLDGIGERRRRGARRRSSRLAGRLPRLSGDPPRPLGVSLGLAVYDPARPETPEALLARADSRHVPRQAARQGELRRRRPRGRTADRAARHDGLPATRLRQELRRRRSPTRIEAPVAEPQRQGAPARRPHSELRPELLYFLAQDAIPTVRAAVAANEATPVQADLLLARDGDDEVREISPARSRCSPPG